MNRGVRVEPTPPECALAAEMFDHFCSASTMKQILALHREICNTLNLKPNVFPAFFPKLKAKLESSWKAQALFRKFDARASQKVYLKGRACPNTRVLVIGAGPCGLRAAIECQLLGAKVVVIEKRDRMSRNNVLHLWPFVIHDLRGLGAKKFFGKFCAGSIDHISIRQLQCILLKVALLLGVEFHEGISFEELVYPTVTGHSETLGWRARVLPADHPVSQYQFDALIGADGKRNTLSGFKRKELRMKLAIAITANFINRHSETEASVPEISGVAFVFHQKFFKDLSECTGIDLENIVYYKDDTHYFVMTAKKHSLLDKGVLLKDFAEVSRLLSVENVDREALKRYAQEAARFVTKGRLPLTDFALNHYGEPDVALFDFTSMYAAENASMVYECLGHRLLCQLVGDSLLEPFWPTGSGCARGFLSALDAAWVLRGWGQNPQPHPLEVIAERETAYRMLVNATPELLHRKFHNYSLDPGTRYLNMVRGKVTPHQVTSYYESDDPQPLDTSPVRKRRRDPEITDEALIAWVGCEEATLRAAVTPDALTALVRRYRPDLMPQDMPSDAVYLVLENECGIVPILLSDSASYVPDEKLRSYLRRVYSAFKGDVPHIHHETNVFEQIKQSLHKENHDTQNHLPAAYTNAAEADKSHSNNRKKRRSVKYVSKDPVEYLCRSIGTLELDNIQQVVNLHEALIKLNEGKKVSEDVMALLDMNEATEQQTIRSSIMQLLQDDGEDIPTQINLDNYFQSPQPAIKRPTRKLKGLDQLTMKPETVKRSSGEPALVLRKWTKKYDNEKKNRYDAKRKYRELSRQRFEKSMLMLTAQPRPENPHAADLENDYGLQQYRASAPHFDERVKMLEKQLHNVDEGRIVGGGGRTAGSGARVARLAAELSGTSAPSVPRATKPKDLMRSVGKIERDDWNVKEIEKKIMQNRLGRPEPRSAEKVPKWDREQFLGRQRRLKEGEATEKWGEIDETLNKFDQKMKDSGRPDHGTKKVADLATKFVKKDTDEVPTSQMAKGEKKGWRGPSSAGMQCASCGTRVFAAEGVIADGLHLHRACFRCAVCKAVLRPGNYVMERYGSRLVCMRHSGTSVPDAILRQVPALTPPTPERISLELSDGGAREIDEDEWTDRNFLASETSGAGLSDAAESSSEEYADAAADDSDDGVAPPSLEAPRVLPRDHLYLSDDSYGYDDCSDSGAESSANESCSKMRAAREARRREVPADARLTSGSSEVESYDESETSKISSATEVSTDSEFENEECVLAPSPPAILVTEPPPPPPPAPPLPLDYPLSRTRSAGGLATKRALELKRRYLLGEPSPPAVRKSDSTSQLDTKLQAFRSNITEFQKMLHPAPIADAHTQKPHPVTVQFTTEIAAPIPDIVHSVSQDAPSNLLSTVEPVLKQDWREEPISEEKRESERDEDLDSDSLSKDSSNTETAPNQLVPRLEVHNEGGELIQLDSLMLVNSDQDAEEKGSCTATVTTVVAASSSSESCRDATTLALTETELSDWAAESAVLDDCNLDERDDKKRCNPRHLNGPKIIHDAKNISSISSHVCGKTSPPVAFSNALEHFEFVDEGDQDPSIETPTTPRNEGYMELVDDEYDPCSPTNDRSMNFIERSFSETVVMPTGAADVDTADPIEERTSHSELETMWRTNGMDDSINDDSINDDSIVDLITPQLLKTIEKDSESSDSVKISDEIIQELGDSFNDETLASKMQRLSLSDISPPLENVEPAPPPAPLEDTSPPLATEAESPSHAKATVLFPKQYPVSVHSSVAGRRPGEALRRSTSRGSESPVSPVPPRDTIDKVQEIKREREEQTEVVRRLVLERMGSGPRAQRKSTRRTRISPVSSVPPPVPPPPVLPPLQPAALPPPRPAPPLVPLPVTPSFSDPELARERRRKSFIKSISNYLNRRLGPRHKWYSEPDLASHEPPAPAQLSNAHKSTGALQEAPPVPPPPAGYCPPATSRHHSARLPGPGSVSRGDVDERDAMQLWFEARWARLVAQRRARDEASEPHARRVARLERRLTRPLSAEQQAATVAELVQVSAQREAHQALIAADRRRNGVGD